ncbi:MAG: chemotaxis protein [Deltaproteobacteria bacterium]|nr:chemotaxis protein [Deltaproteobacteria bacterium]MBP1716605.1 chemotaxis protein [Deltaproteobacteria bacterium]
MPYNVLIVDDSQTMRKVIRKSVVLSGFAMENCWEAGNGKEALAVVQTQKVDLILTDFNMPEMNGMEMTQELKKTEKYRQIPIFFITAQENETLRKEGAALGVQGFIPKPFQPEIIRDLLQKAMEKTGNE